jgi:hypothetical protein
MGTRRIQDEMFPLLGFSGAEADVTCFDNTSHNSLVDYLLFYNLQNRYRWSVAVFQSLFANSFIHAPPPKALLFLASCFLRPLM